MPSLHDLLGPLQDRPKQFIVGRREFDVEKVGFKQFDSIEEGVKLGFFPFDTELPGNRNTGHVYGAQEVQWRDGSNAQPPTALRP